MFARDPMEGVVHPNGARQAALGHVRHTQHEVLANKTVQSPRILVQDGVTECRSAWPSSSVNCASMSVGEGSERCELPACP
jgi:hypothetical protein